MESERSRPPLSVEEFVARILEKRDPIWEKYVEEPHDRRLRRERNAGFNRPPMCEPDNPDDSRSEPHSSCVSPETEAFVARITGRPAPMDTAAFVAAITGADAPPPRPHRAQYLDEAHFNPDEPRDERGRWTTDGSRSSNDGRGLFSINDPIDDTPELSPERKAQLARVAAELDAMVAAGKISKKERDLRYELVKAALGHKMYFDNKQEPNPVHFEKRVTYVGGEEHEEFFLRPGQATAGIHDRVYGISGPGTGTGCVRGAQSLMLEAQAQLAKKLGKSAELDKAVTGKTLDDLYPDEQSSAYQGYTGDHKKGLDPNTFVPGDRVWMQNHRYIPGASVAGGQGSNVIYLGKDSGGVKQFVHMDGAKIETEDQMKGTVQRYTPDESLQDKRENYKFKERYSPKVAPYLGQ